jgi:hypothetical protein
MAGQSVYGGQGARYTFDWRGDATYRFVVNDVIREMESLAALLEGYLHGELHRATGDMADNAYARVEVRGDLIIIRAGSESDHTIYHELRYHPQLRQTMDVWAPRIAANVKAAINRGP